MGGPSGSAALITGLIGARGRRGPAPSPRGLPAAGPGAGCAVGGRGGLGPAVVAGAQRPCAGRPRSPGGAPAAPAQRGGPGAAAGAGAGAAARRCGDGATADPVVPGAGAEPEGGGCPSGMAPPGAATAGWLGQLVGLV